MDTCTTLLLDTNKLLNAAAAETIREYRTAYINRRVPLTLFLLLLPRATFTVSFCAFYFVQAHRETLLCCA